METHQSRFDDIEVGHLTRSEFITEVIGPHYEPGQHVTFIGPTGSGKTTVAYEMLDAIASDKLPAIVLVMKPKDDTVKQWTKLAGFKTTQVWPPITRRGVRNMSKSGGMGKKRRGFVFWPKQTLSNIDRDDEHLAREFKRVLNDCYKKGNNVIFADEVVGLAKELGLEKTLKAIWMRGRSLGCGLWAATQRPFEAPLLMYGQAEHLIIFKDPDHRSVDRFKEIGGINPDIVEDAVYGLKKFEFVYIGRNMAPDGVSPAMAIVKSR